LSFPLRVLVAALAISAATGCRKTSRDSILFADGSPFHIRLVDSHTGQPLSNLEVRLLSVIPRLCGKASCPVDTSVTWTGRSDSKGRIELAKSAIGFGATASADSFELDLLDNATHEGESNWVLELTGNGIQGFDDYPLKLFDDKTGKPLAGDSGIFVFTDRNNRTHQRAIKTNELGYVFIPAEVARTGKHSYVQLKHRHLEFVDYGARHNFYTTRLSWRFDHDK
jgi:hypothetical protein